MRKVATYGVFDRFHEGHVNLLRHARELGDYLIVGVTTNHFDEMRGKLDTVDTLEERMQAVRDCGYADEVIVETCFEQKADDIKRLGIDVLVAGSDWEGRFDYLADLCDVVYLPRTEGVSSSELREQLRPGIRLGIVGTGRIARRLLAEVREVGGIKPVAVYNPNLDSARAFADAAQERLQVAESLDELFSLVDAVYVASPHAHHAEQAKQALCAGKHVLCEKPLALRRADAAELFELAAERGLVLLEAIKTAYCPGFAELEQVLRSGAIGEVKDIEAAFTRLTDAGVRERDDAEYGGSLLEFGSYCLLPAVRLLGPERVERMLPADCYSQTDEAGVDLFTKISMSDEGASVLAKAGLGVKTEGQLLVSGTEGYVLVDAPWWKTSRFEVHHEDPADIEVYEVPFAGDGLRYEISNFAHLVHRDPDREPKLSAAESTAIAAVFEQFLSERGEAR